VSQNEIDDDFTGTDRFQIIRRLGAGGMGVVYEARDRELDLRVALKLLPNPDAPGLFNFKREFRSLATIVHPNLVALHELIADGATWFFTMEIVDGEDFRAFVRPHDRCDYDRLIDALYQLAEAVGALHDLGVLHRDLKPPNVLVRRDGRVAILDFGLTTDLGTELLPGESGSGTIAYMAPEQALGERLTAAADWYAVGVMLFEAIAGRPPFTGGPMQIINAKMNSEPPSLSSLSSDVPAPLEELCADLLRADPAARAGKEQILAKLAEVRSRNPTAEYRAVVRPAFPFVGRERHLASLARAAADVRSGRMTTVHVHGRSGSGKSALVSHFLDSLRDDSDTVVLSGRCYEQESVPYKGIDAVIDSLTRHLLSQQDDISGLLPDNVGVLARLFPVLERVDAIVDAQRDLREIPDARELRRQAFAAIRELLTRLGRTKLLVVHIDDLQWGDLDSAALLTELIRPPDAPPILLIASYRSEYREKSACLDALLTPENTSSDSFVEIQVEAFSADESLELALALLPSEADNPRQTAERIARESAGNPYFIFELARAASGDESVGDVAEQGLVLDDVLWSRVQRLAPKDRELIELLAVSGQPLRLRDAYASAHDPRVDLHMIARMRAEHLVRSTGPRLSDEVDLFHDRIRESVFGRLDGAERRGYHSSLATTLEKAGDVDPETVGAHFEGAGNDERAGVHYATAAGNAARALAFERAARLYRRSIDLRPQLGAAAAPLRVELGHALANAGRGAEAGAEYRLAGDAIPDRRTELLRMAATQLSITGHIDEGREIFRGIMRSLGMRMPSTAVGNFSSLLARRLRLRLRGLEPATTPPRDLHADLERLDTLWSVTTALSAVDVVGVASMQSQALLLALRAAEPRRLALCLAWEAVLVGTGGWGAAERAAELLASARALADRIGDAHANGMVRLDSAWIAFLQFRIGDTIEQSTPAESVFRERCTGVWWELGLTRTMMSWAFTHGGDTTGVGRCVHDYYGDARERGDLALVTNLEAVCVPYPDLVAADPAAAEKHLIEARALWPHKGFHVQHVSLRFSETALHLYRGDGASAYAGFQRDWAPLRWSLQMQNQVTRVIMLEQRARSALAAANQSANPTSLIARAERDAQRIKRESAPWADGFADRILAGVALHRGAREQSIALLRSAATVLEATGLRLHAAATWRRLGQVLGGDEGRAALERGDAEMQRQQVRDVEPMTDSYAPRL